MAHLRRRAALGLAVSLGLTGAACTAAASPTSSESPAHGGGHHGSHSTPRRDRFKAEIASATGAYANHTGRAVVLLHPHGSGDSRRVGVAFDGSPCGDSARCLDLKGKLTGRLTRSRSGVPDTGSRYVLRAKGTLAGMGRVTAQGWVQGTGFIERGQERMRVTLTNSSGSVTLEGHSPPVGGFASP